MSRSKGRFLSTGKSPNQPRIRRVQRSRFLSTGKAHITTGAALGGFGRFFSTGKAHILLLVVGSAFLLTDAFHGNIWFDESYSVAISAHGFGDIWTIGSSDVHPVLFYWMLHCLDLVAGQNILFYRFFTVAGSVAMAVLGYTHLRRDFDWKTGVAFSFLALFIPYMATMAVQIRMYSWAACAVTVCAIYAYRIFRHAQEKIPLHWWLMFFASGFAGACLHYFGTISVFVVYAILGIYLLMHHRRYGKALKVFVAGSAGLLLLYVPWFLVLIKQLGVVTETYWVHFVFPTTVIELIAYPLYTSQVSFALRGSYGEAAQIGLLISLTVLLVAVASLLVSSALPWLRRVVHAKRPQSDKGSRSSAPAVPPWMLALMVYVVILAVAWIASIIMDSLMLYYRYLFVAIGPLIFCCASLLARVRFRSIAIALCASLVATAAINQVLLVSDDYAEENQAPLDYFAATVTPGEPVLSSDIGIEGVTAVTYPDIPQVYLDWQEGNWGRAYAAYAPTLQIIDSWDEVLRGYRGRFIVLGSTSDGSTPRDIEDIQAEYDADILEMKTFYRPYERSYFTIALLQK